MKNLIPATFVDFCVLCLRATSSKKQKEQKRLFADRHWHRTVSSSMTCVDLATKTQVIEKHDTTIETDMVLAIKELEDGQIDFLGTHLYLYQTGDEDKYIHSGGHGGAGGDYMLLYDKPHNKITVTTSLSGTTTDTVQKTYCTIHKDYKWVSTE